MSVDPTKIDQNKTQASQSQGADPVIQSFGQITDVNLDVIPYIKARYFKSAITVVIIFLIYEILWLFLIFFKGILYKNALEILIIPVVILIVLWGIIKNRIEDAFMEQFAVKNNFVFQKTGLPGNLDGSLFSIGYDRVGSDMVSGNFKDLPLYLFNYCYTISYGKSSRTYCYTVFKLDYPSPLPSIFLRVNGHELHLPADDSERISLEGDFNKFFALYAKKGFEVETLEIFTPDFMEKIQDEWKNFSLEFVGTHIYIYSYHVISTKVELDNIYSLAQYLVGKIGPLAERMKASLVALENFQQTSKS